MTRAPLRLVVAALVALAATGCHPTSERSPGTRLQLVHRLVDPALRSGAQVEPPSLVTWDPNAFPTQVSAAARIPRATLRDDTRYVLATHERAVIAYLQPVTPSASARVSARLPLGAALPGAQRLALDPFVQLGDAAQKRLASVLRPLEVENGQRSVQLDLAVPGSSATTPVRLTVVAYRPPAANVTSYQTPELAIPGGAALELAMGILQPALDQGAVRFSVDACHAASCTPLFEEIVDPAQPSGRGWNDRTIPLADLANATRSFRFRTERVATTEGFTLPVWGDPVVTAPRTEPKRRPNVILLSIDTLRRDHLDVYGYSRETAPFLHTKLAGEGMVFDNLTAEASSTDPSHMTMFTSLPALVHGVQSDLKPLAVPVTTLAETVRGQGYRTGAFTEDGPLAQDRGFGIGFDEYMENTSPDLMNPVGQVSKTFAEGRAWLERNGDRPFFLFLHTFQVHAPYHPPDAYHRYFGGDDETGEPVAGPGRAPATEYDREIRYVDDQLAALYAWANQRGLGDDTVWIVLSDHGEEFYEHGSLGHMTLPYQEVLRVPLVMHGPGIARGRCDAPLAHVDLMPTVLDLVGAAPPEPLRGRSFAKLLGGECPPAANPPRPIFSTSWMVPARVEPPAFAVRVGDRKLIAQRDADGERFQYYDLAQDPGETHDLIAERSGESQDLLTLLGAYRQETGETRKALAARGHEQGAGAPNPIALDPAREQTLRALGYIQ